MSKIEIGLYPNAKTTTGRQLVSVEQFHTDVQEGKWQDEILALRAAKQKGATKDDLDAMKRRLPLVTGSGLFKTREDSTLEKHSGFIVIDIDKLGTRLQDVKEQLMRDSLIYSLFVSCSGTGLCGFVKINPRAHQESFYFLSEHFYYKYGLNIDQKCKNLSRARFVSYDPDLYLNPDSQLSAIKPDVKKRKRKPKKYYFADEDFNRIMADIKEAEYDLTEDYQDWIYCGFSLSAQFGEAGREYFHQISEFNPSYDYDACDQKYDNLMETGHGDITVDWFYFIIEQNGFTAYGKGTQDFMQQEQAKIRAYDAGLIDERPLSAAKLAATDIPSLDVAIQVKDFLHAGYTVQKNDMTGDIEINGERLSDELLNTLYILCRSKIDNLNSRELIYQVLDSRFTKRYHDFKELMQHYDENPPEECYGHIDRLIATINTDTENSGYFIKKWLVGIIAGVYGHHNALILILSGGQNTGKTSWFRNLLPERFRSKYYAESKLDEGKDDRILLSRKIIIMDDEMSGKSKQEEDQLKSTTSSQQLDLRVPYGRTMSTLIRIASLCGTANDNELLSDTSGNRRKIPVNVLSIEFDKYNALNMDHLFYEAYLEYMGGYNYELTNADIALLKASTGHFKKSVSEEDLILQYFGYAEENPETQTEWLTVPQIYDYIRARTRVQINTNTLGKYLKALKFEQKHFKSKQTTIRKYNMILLDNVEKQFEQII